MSDETLTLDPAKTALVLIEYQNEFTTDGGVLHGAVAEVMDSTGMLDNTKAFVEKARAAGVTIMHAPITFARLRRTHPAPVRHSGRRGGRQRVRERHVGRRDRGRLDPR